LPHLSDDKNVEDNETGEGQVAVDKPINPWPDFVQIKLVVT
jgi:hypothetical protein